MKKKNNLKVLVLLHLGVMLFSLTGVITKMMGLMINRNQLLSFEMVGLWSALIIIYLIYAVIWQCVLKTLSLTVAYTIKSINLLWSVIWAILIFKDSISIHNVLGIIVILIGISILQKE